MVSIFNSGWKSHLKILAKKRKSKSTENIVKEFVDKGLDEEYTNEVIDFILDYLSINDFPIELEDDILKDYQIDQEDLGDFYTSVLHKKSIPIPKRKEQDDFMKNRDSYPVSLAIEFLMWCEQLSIDDVQQSKN